MSQRPEYSGGFRPYGEKTPRGHAAERQTAPYPHVTPQRIAEAAYYRWQREGGDPDSNWYAAERELQKSIAGRTSDEKE